MALKLSLMLNKEFCTLSFPSTYALPVAPGPQYYHTCGQIHRVLAGWAPHLDSWPLKFLQLHGLTCRWQKTDMALSSLKIETSKLKCQIQGAPVDTRSCFSLHHGMGHLRATQGDKHMTICISVRTVQLTNYYNLML